VTIRGAGHVFQISHDFDRQTRIVRFLGSFGKEGSDSDQFEAKLERKTIESLNGAFNKDEPIRKRSWLEETAERETGIRT